MLPKTITTLAFSIAAVIPQVNVYAQTISADTAKPPSSVIELELNTHSNNPISIKQTPRPDFTKDVLIPLWAAQKKAADEKAAAEAKAAADAAAAAKAAQDAADAAAAVAAQAAQQRSYAYASTSSPSYYSGGSVTYGNNYTPGQCTYYVASRVSVPLSMGNAMYWGTGLLNAGWRTGPPIVGAIGVTTVGWAGHVVYVEAVKGSQVEISEMNYQGVGVVDYRWTNIGEFSYYYR